MLLSSLPLRLWFISHHLSSPTATHILLTYSHAAHYRTTTYNLSIYPPHPFNLSSPTPFQSIPPPTHTLSPSQSIPHTLSIYPPPHPLNLSPPPTHTLSPSQSIPPPTHTLSIYPPLNLSHSPSQSIPLTLSIYPPLNSTHRARDDPHLGNNIPGLFHSKGSTTIPTPTTNFIAVSSIFCEARAPRNCVIR